MEALARQTHVSFSRVPHDTPMAGHTRRVWSLLLVAAAVAAYATASAPADLAAFECAVATFAASYATPKVLPTPGSAQAIADALNVQYLCNGTSVGAEALAHPDVATLLKREAARLHADRAAQASPLLRVPPPAVSVCQGRSGNCAPAVLRFLSLGSRVACTPRSSVSV